MLWAVQQTCSEPPSQHWTIRRGTYIIFSLIHSPGATTIDFKLEFSFTDDSLIESISGALDLK